MSKHFEYYTQTFTVDGPPVPAVRMTRKSKHTNKYAQAYLAYKEVVGWAYKAKYGDCEPFTGPVALSVEVSLAEPAKRRWDASNVLKAVEDSLNTLAYVDDRQIFLSHVDVLPSKNGLDFVYVHIEGTYASE